MDSKAAFTGTAAEEFVDEGVATNTEDQNGEPAAADSPPAETPEESTVECASTSVAPLFVRNSQEKADPQEEALMTRKKGKAKRNNPEMDTMMV